VAALNDLARVVVLGEGRPPAAGILTDVAHELVRLPASEIRAVPDGVAAKREWLRGVTAGAVLVLDASTLLRSLA
jgi:chemotaxis signal transduction protein